MTMLPNIEEAMKDARNGKLSPYWQNNLKREYTSALLAATILLPVHAFNFKLF